MAKEILQYFKAFKDLKINYSDNDFQTSYRGVITPEDFEKALSYDSLRADEKLCDYHKVKGPFRGAFHLVLNVKVDADSQFIPFAYITNSDKDKADSAKDIVKTEQDNIGYNFTKLLDNLTQENSNVAVEAISFKTFFRNGVLVVDQIRVDDTPASESQKNIIQTCANAADSFISILSNKYREKNIATDLYYDILSFDYDFKSGRKLTQFLVITENEEECYFFTQVRVRALRDIVSIIRTRYVSDIAQKNLYESIKSAVAAIMSRNMSHNLGSHFLYYAKDHLSSLADSLNERMSPDIRGDSKVLEYTQARMDYLATLISNDKYPYGAVNFKSQIYDILTLDDFSKRHFEIGVDSQTKIPRQYNRTVNYLLTNLVLSEDFTRPNIYDDDYTYEKREEKESNDLLQLQVKYSSQGNQYDTFTGTNYTLDADDDPDDFPDVITMEKEIPVKEALSSINIALPGGNMSCHAFFNVIENFIRNSAKYLRDDFEKDSDGNKNLLTTLALRYKDESHKYIEFVIYDNKHNATRYKLLHATRSFGDKISKLLPNSPKIDFSLIDSCIEKETSDLDTESIAENALIKSLQEIIDHITNLPSSDDNAQMLSIAKSLMERWKQPCLFEQMRNRLISIKILGENNVLDKENKGLKEMMFSSAWMRSYTFADDKTYADIVFDIQKASTTKDKEELIHNHCFIPVAVIDNNDGTIDIIDDINKIGSIYYKPACFGIIIELPVFQKKAKLSILSEEREMIQNSLDVYADIIAADMNAPCPLDIAKTFTRTCPIEDYNTSETALLRNTLRKRFPGFDDYKLIFGNRKEACGLSDSAHIIKFVHHLKDHENLEDNRCFAYADSVSGGNFTKTMNELFDAYVDKQGEYVDAEQGEYFCLKIKESALTRITLIDERLARSMTKSKRELELQLKNIRVLNYRDCNRIHDISDLFIGNSFSDGRNDSHFLSIHLGLIEKIIKSDEFIEYIGEVPEDKRAKAFMQLLRNSFGGDNVFISVHSGRGNFSAELEDQLANYPFISLSAIENTYNNSKYLLSQLFYNTVYIGKGRINHAKI